MDRSGNWSLAPAYDVTFAYNPAGAWTSSHQMTINGKQSGFEKEDFENCRKIASLKKKEADEIFDEMKNSVQRWKDFADEAGVGGERSEAIWKIMQTMI